MAPKVKAVTIVELFQDRLWARLEQSGIAWKFNRYAMQGGYPMPWPSFFFDQELWTMFTKILEELG